VALESIKCHIKVMPVKLLYKNQRSAKVLLSKYPIDKSRIGERKEGGAVLVEFALVLPFIILLLTGVIEFGRYFTHSNWLFRTGYETAMLAMTYPRDNAKMWAGVSLFRGGFMFSHHNGMSTSKDSIEQNFGYKPSGIYPDFDVESKFKSLERGSDTVKAVDINYDETDRKVIIDVRGEMKAKFPIFVEFNLPVSLRVQGPSIVMKIKDSITSLQEVANPPFLFDCNKQPTSCSKYSDTCASTETPCPTVP